MSFEKHNLAFPRHFSKPSRIHTSGANLRHVQTVNFTQPYSPYFTTLIHCSPFIPSFSSSSSLSPSSRRSPSIFKQHTRVHTTAKIAAEEVVFRVLPRIDTLHSCLEHRQNQHAVSHIISLRLLKSSSSNETTICEFDGSGICH